MKNSLKSCRDSERIIVADLTCIPRQHLPDAASLVVSASLLLSRTIRRNTSLYITVKLGGKTYSIEACGSRIRGFRPDIGSSTGFLRRVIRDGCFGGVCLLPGTPQLTACVDIAALLFGSKCPSPASKPVCLKAECSYPLAKPWWLIAAANILLDNCFGA